jgi:predicted ATPase
VAEQPILTPDRRLRVFVSSTLRELALERVEAREAIASLRLAPILFEQGARPHPPRDLYSAYVAQCDVFVGIYWQSYGWVVCAGEISGIEDEFELGQGKPMLLYVKEPAPRREEGLGALIERIEREGHIAYRLFSAPAELRAFVMDDLAHLLAERFDASAEQPEAPSALPARTTSFVGRERELEEIVALFGRVEVRLVTLTGSGGIGKTQLALESARRLAASFSDGAAYVALDRLTDPDLVPAAIAEAVGLSPLGPDQQASLARMLRNRRLLLVVDNLEHLLVSAPLLTQLLEASPDLKVLATSREPLRLQGEYGYAVPPLADAPKLFMERVAAVRPEVVWHDENLEAAREICRRVDAVPLAVELVAAGARLFEPRVLIDHLRSPLDAPSAGRRDAPSRHLTMRATLDWSYRLLTDSERDLFERLGVFAGSFTVEAARSLTGDDGAAALATLSALVDKHLVLHAASESETRFRMLQVVSDYAAEHLSSRPDGDDVRAAHAAHYQELARAAYAGLRGAAQREWKDVLDLEGENVRGAVVELVRLGRPDDAVELIWGVWPYWFTGMYLEGRKILSEVALGSGKLSGQARARVDAIGGILAALLADLSTGRAALERALAWYQAHDDDDGRAVAFVGLGIATAPFDSDRARELMADGARLFTKVGDDWGEAIALNVLGWLDVGRGDFSAPELFERAYVLARELDDEVTTAHAATDLAELRVAQSRFDDAREALRVAFAAHEAVRLYDGLSYGLEAAARVASAAGHPEDAVLLLGAADRLRSEAGIPIWGPRLDRFEALKNSLREGLAAQAFDSAWTAGQILEFEESLDAGRRSVR